MAKLNSSAIQVYYGIYNVGTALRSIQVILEQDALDQTSLNDVGEKILAGIRKDGVALDGLFDDSASAEQAGADLIGSTSNNVMSVFFGSATGSLAYVGSLILSATKPATKIGELVKLNLEAKAFGTWQRGLVCASSTITTGTVEQGFGWVDGGALSTNGGTFFIHVLGRTGASTNFFFARWTASPGSGSFGIGGLQSTAGPGTTGVYIMVGTGTIGRYVQLYDSGTGTATFCAVFVRS